jgi:hypothetical protein
LPYRPYATDDYSQGIQQEWRGRALTRRYLSPNTTGYAAWLIFDVDKSDASTSWLNASLPPPNLIVVNPLNGHAHIAYRLRGWIRLAGDQRPVRWLESIRRAYTVALGADPRYVGLLCKNPLHSAWKTTVARDAPYDLAELSRYADFFADAGWRRAEVDEITGRNTFVFDKLRHWAYRAVGQAKAIGDRNRWHDDLHDHALQLAIEARRRFTDATHPYTDSEVGHTVKSIANWTWDVYRGRDPKADERRQDGQRQWAQDLRRKQGAEKRQAYIERLSKKRREAARRNALGETVEDIATSMSISIRSVYRAIAEFGAIERAAAELLRGGKAKKLLPPTGKKSDRVGAGGTFINTTSKRPSEPAPVSRLMAYVSAAIERLTGRGVQQRC